MGVAWGRFANSWFFYDAREAIRTETATLIDIDTTDEEEEADPFADIEEDENELEENELVLHDC